MKKVYLSILMSILVSLSFGQQVFLTEDFTSNQMPPNGWTIDNMASQWSVQNSSKAGGTAPEARFKWINTVSTSRLISPPMDLTGVDMVVISFNHFLDNYGGGNYQIGVATRSGNGDWNSVWEVAPNANVGPEFKLLEIQNSDVGSSDFQICFYLNGNFYNLDYWYLDDIKVFAPANVDAQLSGFSTPEYVNGAVDITGQITNFGLEEINSFDVEWQVEGDDEVHTSSFSGISVPFGETYDFTCGDQFNFPIGSYNVTLTVTNVNGAEDENASNNSITKTINVVSHTVDKRACLEEFTSSTCSPCAQFNSQFVPWCENHADEMTLVKYQMNWPGSGDPYYTQEGGIRRQYYGVSWVPWLEGDGSQIETSISAAQAVINQAAQEGGLIKIASSFSVTGTEITVNTTFVPFANFENLKFLAVVFENETTGNTGSNGETSFQHVMMKMLPNADGELLNVTDRQPQTFTYTVDLSNTNVEEYDDLGVAIICQNEVSRKIYQSAYSVENGSFATEARLSSLTVDGEPLEGFDPDTYEYNVELPEGTTEVPVVDGELMDDNGMKIVVPATGIPGTTTIDTYGEDLATHITYKVNFSIINGVEDNAADVVNVYPNPTSGKFYISGVTGTSKVKVYSLKGSVVYENDKFNNDVIDLSNVENGVYFVSVTDANNKTLTKKISIMK